MTTGRRFRRELRRDYGWWGNRAIKRKLTLREEHPTVAITSELNDASANLLWAEMALSELVRWFEETEPDRDLTPLRKWQKRLEDTRIEFDSAFFGHPDPRRDVTAPG